MNAESQTRTQPERERVQFTQLLMSNPNYFGTLPESIFEPQIEISGNNFYEELTCVGYNPKLNTLEATVQIKRSFGYGGNLCQGGSTEYVRFFIDYGSGWQNVGLVAFNIHDIPDGRDCFGDPEKPLSYLLSLPFDPQQNFCGKPVLPRVRAILSWQAIPPDNNPNHLPVWGNVLDRHIQIKPRKWWLGDLVDIFKGVAEIELPAGFEAVASQLLPQPDPGPLQLVDLARRYTGKEEEGVEAHRFGMSQIQALMANAPAEPQAIESQVGLWKELGIDLLEAIEALSDTSGNTSYEELDCLALDYNRDWLGATFTIKRPNGYSGDLCDPGSYEYVAFWADWDDNCEWSYLGTVAINVHDIARIPAGGLHYTAVLPVNLSAYRQPCSEPKVVRVRAVLSWNTPPSTGDPDAVPYWGNRIDTHVQIKPGEPGKIQAEISILGGVGIADINTGGNGLTKPFALMAPWGTYADAWAPHNRECPFGGQVTVHATPNVGYKYRVLVHKVGDAAPPAMVTNKIWVVDSNGVGSWHYADASGFFDYLDVNQNVLNLLATWGSGEDGLWEIRLELANSSGTVLDTTPWHRIYIDNTDPTASIDIDGGACDQYTPGTTITGRFVARDPYFGAFSLNTLPSSLTPPNPATATPATTQTSLAGDVWTLNTSGMQVCGYVVEVNVWDRTIRNSQPGSHNFNRDDKGFCLLNE